MPKDQATRKENQSACKVGVDRKMSEKVLLDECVPRRFKFLLDGFEVEHAKDPKVGLNGIHDSAVFRKASEKEHRFDVVVTVEGDIHQHIGDERQYKVGIVVLKLGKAVDPTLENLAPLVPQAKEAIKLVQKGEMYHVHASGQIEKVTYQQLCERDEKQKVDKLERGIEKKQELEKWHEQRPASVSVEEWSREFGRKKQEEHRQGRADQEQQSFQRR